MSMQPRIETTDVKLTNYFVGLLGADPAGLSQLLKYPSWRELAAQEIQRRETRIIQLFDQKMLEDIAAGRSNVPNIIGNIIDCK